MQATLLSAVRKTFESLSAEQGGQGIVLGRYYPLRVTVGDRSAAFLCQQQRPKTAAQQAAALTLLTISQARQLADSPLQPVLRQFRLTGRNELVEEGASWRVTDEQAGFWLAHGMPWVPGLQVRPDSFGTFVKQVENEYGAAGADPRAIAFAKASVVGTVAQETIQRPSGSQWHTYYLTLPDQHILTLATGSTPLNGDELAAAIPEAVAKHAGVQQELNKRRQQQATIHSKEIELARQHNFILGSELGPMIPNDGKQVQRCRIIKDYANGHFDVVGTRGPKQVILEHASASTLIRARDRYMDEAKPTPAPKPAPAAHLDQGDLFSGAVDQDDLFAAENEVPQSAPRYPGMR